MSRELFRQRPNRALWLNALCSLAISCGVAGLAGCADRHTAEVKAREDAAAKAQAEAAKKEMEKLPQKFKARYNEKIEPAGTATGSSEQKASNAAR